MKLQNIGSKHPASHDTIEGHIAAFVADLRAAGYARGTTLSVKRVTLQWFISWLGRPNRTSLELTESEIRRAPVKVTAVRQKQT